MVQIESGGRMNIWSIVVAVLYTLSLGVDLAKHGQQRTGKYNFWASLLAFGIIVFCLYMGGFFK